MHDLLARAFDREKEAGAFWMFVPFATMQLTSPNTSCTISVALPSALHVAHDKTIVGVRRLCTGAPKVLQPTVSSPSSVI